MTQTIRKILAAAALMTAAAASIITANPAHALDSAQVAAFGDSVTAGAGTTDPERRAYPTVAGVTGIGHGGQCLVTVGCGYPTPLVETFADDLKTLHPRPRVVVIESGLNDLAHISDVEFLNAYRKLVRIGRQLDVRVVIATITPSNHTLPWHDALQGQRLRVNQMIRARGTFVEYARQLEGARKALRPAFDSGDGLHPNDEGARRMADALVEWIAAHPG